MKQSPTKPPFPNHDRRRITADKSSDLEKALSREEGERLLRQGAERLGILLSPLQTNRFWDYLTLLKKWNRHLNLTGLRKDRDIIVKHFLDCLLPLPFIPVEAPLMDLGSGAGFPGIPIQIIRPLQPVILLEASAKKTTFLKEVCRRLSLSQTIVVQGRLDKGSPCPPLPPVEVVVTRAVGRPLALLEGVRPILKSGGKIIFMQGPQGLSALGKKGGGLQAHGFSPSPPVSLRLPILEQERILYILTKNG